MSTNEYLGQLFGLNKECHHCKSWGCLRSHEEDEETQRPKGIIPEILSSLMDERRKVKEEMQTRKRNEQTKTTMFLTSESKSLVQTRSPSFDWKGCSIDGLLYYNGRVMSGQIPEKLTFRSSNLPYVTEKEEDRDLPMFGPFTSGLKSELTEKSEFRPLLLSIYQLHWEARFHFDSKIDRMSQIQERHVRSQLLKDALHNVYGSHQTFFKTNAIEFLQEFVSFVPIVTRKSIDQEMVTRHTFYRSLLIRSVWKSQGCTIAFPNWWYDQFKPCSTLVGFVSFSKLSNF